MWLAGFSADREKKWIKYEIKSAPSNGRLDELELDAIRYRKRK